MNQNERRRVSSRLTLNVILLGQSLSTLNSDWVAIVPDGNVAAHLGVREGHRVTNASAAAGDDGRLAGEGEALQEGAAIDPALVVADKVSSVERVEGRVNNSVAAVAVGAVAVLNLAVRHGDGGLE